MQGRWLRRVLALGLLVSLFSVVAGAGSAHAWWDAKWKYRKKIVLDTTPQGGDIKEALTDYPVLVRLHSGNFTFANAKSDGTDIRFVAGDDKTPLKYHIERYDPAEEMVLIWVKVPRIPASGRDSLWVYYGNNAAADGQDAGGTYDTPQLGVYHLGEKEGVPQDATSYKNQGKEFAGKLGIPSAIGRGITLNGEGDRLVIAGSPSLSFAKGFTFSAWVRLIGPQADGRLFSWDDGKQSMVIAVEGTRLRCDISGRKTAEPAPVELPQGKWVHVAVTMDAGKTLSLYTDGQERSTSKLSVAIPAPAADIVVGGSLQGKHGFAGAIDEVGIAGVARSAAWVHAAAMGQGPETPLLSYLEEEGSSGGAESLTVHLLVVTAKAITLDGWLIIGAIVIMIALTWILFLNKFMALRKLKKENAAFSEVFTGSGSLRAVNENEEPFLDSSLFRVYGAGLDELDRRLMKMKEAGGTSLPGHALTAFEAALNKAAMQESKKNTAGLLIFTLSISGGPFMGLFGTVWGVINTFAGVAEAGEANLAAIAPGVASALACTLMGLVLAIPALFQYSYLSEEIKHISVDMNVFMDEMTNRVEEEYGGKA
jgi:biopolymer transport protein ExbB